MGGGRRQRGAHAPRAHPLLQHKSLHTVSGFYIARLTPLYRFGSRGSRFARAQNSEWRARRKRRGRPLPTEDHCTAYAIALVWVGGGRRLEGEAWRTEKLDSDVRPTPVTPTVAPLNTYTFLKSRLGRLAGRCANRKRRGGRMLLLCRRSTLSLSLYFTFPTSVTLFPLFL